MNACRLLLVLVLGIPAAGHSEEAASEAAPAPAEKPAELEATDVTACAQRNLPEPDSLRAVRITRRDRDGNEKVSRLRMYGRRNPEGLREMVLRFAEPEDIKGVAFLFIERADGNDIYFTSPEFNRPKRIESKGRGAELFGTDLTYEDFEHMHGINRPGEWKRQADDVVRERPVYVIETRPADPETAQLAIQASRRSLGSRRMKPTLSEKSTRRPSAGPESPASAPPHSRSRWSSYSGR